MREIKFRAWDKKTKNMYQVKGISFTWRWASWDTEVLQSQYKGFDDIELMQFTGLRDKNGKEIWEGDILEYADKSGMGVVRFGEGAFYLETNLKNWRGDIYESEEVIGNIWENPELLGA